MRNAIFFGLVVFLQLAGCGRNQSEGSMTKPGGIAKITIGGQEMMLVPSSESAKRVENLGLPQRGSEDVSHLLIAPPNLPQQSFDKERDYRPEETVEWVIDIEFEGSPVFSSSEILNAFDRAWLDANGRPTIFGWSPEINHWTFVIAADTPKTFNKLAIGWAIYKPYDEKYHIKADELERYLTEAQRQAARLGKPATRTNLTPLEAEKKATLIRDTVAKCDRDVVIILKSLKGTRFDGKAVWDVMLCLGLPWGDGDLFHWHNEAGFGHDMFFSVATSTPPGYFLPERIVAGKTQVDDLVFGFSIPRSAEPLAVLDSMLKAVAYIKGRLGGEILDRDGQPFNESLTKREIQEIVNRLKEAGFTPGEDATLQMF